MKKEENKACQEKPCNHFMVWNIQGGYSYYRCDKCNYIDGKKTFQAQKEEILSDNYNEECVCPRCGKFTAQCRPKSSTSKNIPTINKYEKRESKTSSIKKKSGLLGM